MSDLKKSETEEQKRKPYTRKNARIIPSDIYKEAASIPPNKEIAWDVKKQLSQIRMDENITIKQLAKLIGKSPSTVSAWKKRTNQAVKPDYRDLIIMRKYFKISLDEIFDKAFQNVIYERNSRKFDNY